MSGWFICAEPRFIGIPKDRRKAGEMVVPLLLLFGGG